MRAYAIKDKTKYPPRVSVSLIDTPTRGFTYICR
jgi:hypothetical protein